VHTRLLLALPLLVGAEPIVHRGVSAAMSLFLERGIVTDAGKPRFEAAIASVKRLSDSTLVEVLMLVLVYALGIGVVWRQLSALHIDSWYYVLRSNTQHVTVAGSWYMLVSLPLFQFILLRWYFRVGLWAWFLARVASTRLNLVPTHPDRCGGLGLLEAATRSFAPLLIAHGILFTGIALSGILLDARTLRQYAPELIVLLVFMALIAFGPLLAFVPSLMRTRRAGLEDYGLLAQRYVRAFDRKWIRSVRPPEEPLLGTEDIQALADLSHSYDIVTGIRFIPVDRDTALILTLALLLPIVPLLFTLVSPHELLQLLLKGLAA
jgi:hypothetical protein